MCGNLNVANDLTRLCRHLGLDMDDGKRIFDARGGSFGARDSPAVIDSPEKAAPSDIHHHTP